MTQHLNKNCHKKTSLKKSCQIASLSNLKNALKSILIKVRESNRNLTKKKFLRSKKAFGIPNKKKNSNPHSLVLQMDCNRQLCLKFKGEPEIPSILSPTLKLCQVMRLLKFLNHRKKSNKERLFLRSK